MSVPVANDELHEIVDSLEESEVPFALQLLRSLSHSGSNAASASVQTSEHRSGVQNGTAAGASKYRQPWFDIIGMIDDDGPTDMSVHHDAYLADEYSDNHEE